MNAKLSRIENNGEFEKKEARSVTNTKEAPGTNHLSCWRSSPAEPTNRVITAANDTANAPTISTMRKRKAAGGPLPDWACGAKGSCQTSVDRTRMATVTTTPAEPTYQAAGRHRRERNRPVGNRRNTKSSRKSGISPVQLDTHATACP